MTRKAIAILILLSFSIVTAGFGADARLEVRLDRDQARIGEPIVYTLRVPAAPGESVVFPEPADGRFGDFEINRSSEETREDGVRERRYLLQGFETGSFAIPAPEVTIRGEGGEETVLAGPELEVEIISVLGEEEEDADIRELKSPVGLPRSYRWILYLAAAAAVFTGAAILLYRKFFRRKPAAPPPPPPRAAGEIALEELDRIRKADLPGRGLIKEYYSRVSDTVRRYLENRFALRAPERTTEEFLQEMATTSHLTGDQQQLVADFLEESDLVKFARYGPTEREIAGVFAAAVRLIEETEEGEPHRQECLCYSPGRLVEETGERPAGVRRPAGEARE